MAGPSRPPDKPNLPDPRPAPLESTAALLERIRGGDEEARNRLLGRYLPVLRQWARGRLPRRARDLSDTDDLVQVTLLRALDRLKEFEPRREGAFLAYLRRILLNLVRDEARRGRRTPGREELDAGIPDDVPSPLERLVGHEKLEAYEAALEELPAVQREAVILRLEMGFSHREVAEAIGSSTADAARMLVARGVIRIAERLHGGR